jgi:glyoxylase-like metal-dependent hydrolase (beta-lactamase superfamily II)
MAFLTEPEPARDVVIPVAAGISRIVAANPGPMTYHGTNTYLIEGSDGVSVLDPGPDDPAHVQAILRATGGRVARILLSHAHRDHFGALAALRAATGAPSHGFSPSQAPGSSPDIPLHDGAAVAELTALHTPGHAADHLCFARADGIIFTADHVMTWSTSVVSPPAGDMAAYFASLHRLLARDDGLLLPGHGPPLAGPRPYVEFLLTHRKRREAAVLSAIATAPQTPASLTGMLYAAVDPRLRAAAGRTVLAHLLKLQAEGRAVQQAGLWRAA